MRTVFICIIVGVSLGKGIFAQKQDNQLSENIETIKREILALEQEKIKALSAGGQIAATWFEQHYDENIDYTNENGSFFTKAQTVEEFRSGARKLHSVQHDDYTVRVYGNTAVLTYRGNDVMERNGNVGERKLVQTTDVYVREPDGVWRIVVHHVTPVRSAR